MDGLTRRQLLGAAAACWFASGCDIGSLGGAQTTLVREPDDVEVLVDSASLEKPDLAIRYLPVNDCTPFAVASTKGYFKKRGLRVRLSRESSRAASRDGVISGRLDASPVVSGAVVNARLGAEGAIRARMCVAMTIHRHRNAITMNRAMWDAGLRPLHEYGGDLTRMASDLRGYVLSLPPQQRVFAVVLSSAIYECIVRNLFAFAELEARAARAWRSDLYSDIAAELDIACALDDYKPEPASRFFDGVAFDASDPEGYLRQFDIHSAKPRARFIQREYGR